MTIATTANRAAYAGDGSTTDFSFPYEFIENSDLVVILKDSDGTETTQTLDTDYSVTGAGDSSGGTVTMSSAPDSDQTLTIYRDVTQTQELHLVENEALPAADTELAFDKLTMMVQRLNDRVDRAVRLTDGVSLSDFSPLLPESLEALKVLRVNGAGDAIETVDPADATFAASLSQFTDGGSDHQVLKYNTDEGSNVKWTDSDTINLADFGVDDTGVTDCTTKFQEAVDAAQYKTLKINHGNYKVSSTINITASTRIVGDPMRGTHIDWYGGASPIFHVTNDTDNVEIDSISWGNYGTATMALQLDCVRFVISRCFCNPSTKFTTAVIKTWAAGNVYHGVFRDCYFTSYTNGQEIPIGIYVLQGHTINFENCMFSGITRSVVLGASQSVQQANFFGCRLESFDGAGGYPGTNSDIGIDAVYVSGLLVAGSDFEYGNGNVAISGQRCIKLRNAIGVGIVGCSFNGTGANSALINIANSAASGIEIYGNYFFRFAGSYAVELTSSGSFAGVNFGVNTVWDLSGHAVASGVGNSGARLGAITGTAPAAGYIGEVIEGTVTNSSSVGTSGQWFDATSAALTKGNWLVSAVIDFDANGATVSSEIQAGISVTTGNFSTGLQAGVNLVNGPAPTSSNNRSLTIPSYIVKISSDTTHYLKATLTYSSATPKYNCRLTAVRLP